MPNHHNQPLRANYHAALTEALTLYLKHYAEHYADENPPELPLWHAGLRHNGGMTRYNSSDVERVSNYFDVGRTGQPTIAINIADDKNVAAFYEPALYDLAQKAGAGVGINYDMNPVNNMWQLKITSPNGPSELNKFVRGVIDVIDRQAQAGQEAVLGIVPKDVAAIRQKISRPELQHTAA